ARDVHPHPRAAERGRRPRTGRKPGDAGDPAPRDRRNGPGMNPTVSSPQNTSAVGAASLGAPGPGAAGPDAAASAPRRQAPAWMRPPGALSFRNIGAVYVWLA